MFLSCFFIRKKIILFVLNKIFYKFISSMFFVDLNYSFWSSFLYFSYVECIHALPYIHHAPWPREFLFAQKGFVCFVLKGVCLICPHEGFVCFVLKGVCLFYPHEGFVCFVLMSNVVIWEVIGIYSLSWLFYQQYCLTSKSHRLVF